MKDLILGDNIPYSNPLYVLSSDVPLGYRIWTSHGFYLLNEKMNRTAVFDTLEEAIKAVKECDLNDSEIYHFYDSLFFPRRAAMYDKLRYLWFY